jgi:uracil-DNA glycosylase
MLPVVMPRIGFAEAWRSTARDLVCKGVRPQDVEWRSEAEEGGLFGGSEALPEVLDPHPNPTVPKAFPAIVAAAVCHSAPARFSLPYRLLWRLQTNHALLGDRADADVAELFAMEKAVRRDAHKMHAFVRFRELEPVAGGRRCFGTWFEPRHHIVEHAVPFFTRRFADMDWTIATPDLVARFVDGRLSIDICDERPDLPEDNADDLWRTYFAHIFNPARLKVKAMKSEMPVRYWKNMPEARLIPELIAGAESAAREMQEKMPTFPHHRTDKVVARVSARDVVGDADSAPASIEGARRAALACTRCDLCRQATQTVFGEGPLHADVMFVGEQPGDYEDLAGKPFVGPAGRLLDAMLEEAGIDRDRSYVTNAVKHFKFVPRGKRRLHQRPNAHEIERCRWWLDIERSLVGPKLIVALGATAAQAVTGDGKAILKRRGTVEKMGDGTVVYITIHPSAVLRAGEEEARIIARNDFLEDLKRLRGLIDELAS